MRLLITGMGGELGTRVAQLLETNREVSDIAGLDVDPPRRRGWSDFHRINPRTARSVAFVRVRRMSWFIWASTAERAPVRAARPSARASVSILGGGRVPVAALHRRQVWHRVYGRRRGVRHRASPRGRRRDPTSPFGSSARRGRRHRHLGGLGRRRAGHAPAHGASRGSSRAEPARSLLADGAHRADQRVRRPDLLAPPSGGAVAAIIAATIAAPYDGPLNVVRSARSLRSGGPPRRPHPAPDPRPRAATHPTGRRAVGLAGPAPRARGAAPRRTADGTLANEVLRIAPRSTVDVVKDLYDWATVTHLRPAEAA